MLWECCAVTCLLAMPTCMSNMLALQIIEHLVDPASSHMLVSKTKPCMSQTQLVMAHLRMAH